MSIAGSNAPDEIKQLAGEYLPVFDGVELSSDWKSFFKFRTELHLADYLELLSEISKDVTENKEIRSQFSEVSYIYSYVWYGEFPIDSNTFKTVEKKYKFLFNSIN